MRYDLALDALTAQELNEVLEALNAYVGGATLEKVTIKVRFE